MQRYFTEVDNILDQLHRLGLIERAPVVQYRAEDLAIPCHPDEEVVSQDMHKHRCGACGTTWKHGNEMTGASREQFWEAHTCPKCGREETEKYGVYC